MIVACYGTAGYHPSPIRHTSCYYLPDLSLLLDAGTGLFHLASELIDSPKESLDILLSHAHLDHVAGLTFLLGIAATTSLKQVRVHGEADKLAAVREHLYNELIFPVSPFMEFCPLDPAAYEFRPPGRDDLLVEWMPLEHPGGSAGFIITARSRRLAYITDTTARPASPYVDRLVNIDLLLHECNFRDDQRELAERTGHSWLSGVVDVVRRTRPKRTVLVHLNPLADISGEGLVLTPDQQELAIEIVRDGDRLLF